MSDDSQQPIVVKRIKKGGGGAHGGAWKIAYADFVTAMMAFFLLMWLLGSTAQGDLQGISDHFNTPLKVAMAGGSGTGDSSSILKGGGQDLTRSVGQVKRGDVASRSTVNVAAAGGTDSEDGQAPSDTEAEAARKAFEKLDRARLIDVQGQIEALMEASASLRKFKNQILMEITSDGLQIQIIDEQNRPMFDSASSALKPYTRELLQTIGRTLNGVPNRVSLTGHTDSTSYGGGERGFSNWELSANRANASRREMVVGGLDPDKVVRVVGLADTMPFLPEDTAAPQNRRITIVVLSRKQENAATDVKRMNLPAEQPVDAGSIERRVDRLSAPPAQPEPRSRRSFRERLEAARR